MYSHSSTRHQTKATRIFRRLALLLLFTSALVLIASEYRHAARGQWPSAWPACRKTYEFENNYRKLTGAFNSECGSYGVFPSWHSAPWGNWGVDSPYGTRYDGFQFPGWKVTGGDDWYQWNSCTTTKAEYRAPSPCSGSDSYYNDSPTSAGCRTQSSSQGAAEHASTYVIYYHSPGIEYSCASIVSGAEVVLGLWMTPYELDSDGDDKVSKLSYPTVSVPMNCNTGNDTCTGTSSWYSQSGSDRPETGLSADIRVKVRIEPI